MPGVQDCAVFGIPDEEYGERVGAVVEPRPGARLTEDAVLAYLRARLAGYKVPSRIDFRADLPREDSGKIFKRKLREPFWAKAGPADLTAPPRIARLWTRAPTRSKVTAGVSLHGRLIRNCTRIRRPRAMQWRNTP